MSLADASSPLIGGAAIAAITAIADMATPQFPDLTGLVSDLFGIGFVTWYAWFTTSKVIPDLVKDFRAELAAERARSNEQLSIERADNREQSLQLSRDINDLTAAVDKLADQVAK